MRKAFYMIFAAVMMCSCGIYTKYEPQTSVPDNLYGDSLSYGTDTASLGNVYWRELFTDTLLQNLIERDWQTTQTISRLSLGLRRLRLHCWLQSWPICLRLPLPRKAL